MLELFRQLKQFFLLHYGNSAKAGSDSTVPPYFSDFYKSLTNRLKYAGDV
jgi:hypothetical protein